MKTYNYRSYRIDLHPYAGGYKAFIFPPGGSGLGIEPYPVLAAPDGREAETLRKILRDSRYTIDALLRRRAA
jgi:hypothetical protein